MFQGGSAFALLALEMTIKMQKLLNRQSCGDSIRINERFYVKI